MLEKRGRLNFKAVLVWFQAIYLKVSARLRRVGGGGADGIGRACCSAISRTSSLECAVTKLGVVFPPAVRQGMAPGRSPIVCRPKKHNNMNSNQSNKLRAYQAVELVLETHAAAWASLPAFATAVGEFTAVLPEINALAQTQASREGASNEKAYALAALGNAAFEVGAAVHAFAVTTQDYALEGRVDFSRSTIGYGREASVLARVRDIHAAATANLAKLADYGVSQTKLTALRKKIDAFEASLARPRQQIAESSAATQTLSQQFTAADTILNKRLDKLVYQFKATAPDFFNAYQTARSIVDLRGSRKPNDTPTPTPVPQPA